MNRSHVAAGSSAHPFVRQPEPRLGILCLTALWIQLAGRRDGRRGIPHLPSELRDGIESPNVSALRGDTSADVEGPVVGRLRHAYAELDEREYLAGLAIVEVPRREIAALLDRRNAKLEELAVLRRAADALSSAPRLGESDVVRGPAERDTPMVAVVARRQRAQDALAASARAEVSAAERDLGRLDVRYAELVAQVTDVWDAYLHRTLRVLAHYERRIAIYRRAIVLSHRNGPLLQRLWGDSSSLTAPARIDGPCPWLPSSHGEAAGSVVPAPATELLSVAVKG